MPWACDPPLRDRGRWAGRWLPPHSDRLLDVGCASGYFTVHFARRAGQTWAVDVNEAALREARRAGPTIGFQVASVTALPFPPAIFEAVTMLDVLEHVPVAHQVAALVEVGRVIRPGGVLILSVPHRGLFTIADPDNLEYRFPRLYRWLTGQRASPDTPEHLHYTQAQVVRLLTQAGFQVRRTHRSSLLLYPLALWLEAAAVRLWGSRHPLSALLAWLRDLSYAIPCGPAAYNLMVCAVRQPDG